MKISIITLFPSMFEGPFATSMLKKAQDDKLLEIELIDLREYGIGPRKTVDDTPYGGGAGMVLKPEPIFAAVEKIKKASPTAHVILVSPRGKTFHQPIARDLSQYSHLVFICGHYEGVDERVSTIVDSELSMGDFVLTGGEIPTMAMVDAVARLIPGVLGDKRSTEDESFSRGLLEYPHYTRPDEFRGMKVPEELKSGHHANIENWRRQQAIEKTRQNRPDLTDF